MRDALRILWHEWTCVAAKNGASAVFHSRLGRSYECGCGFHIIEAYKEDA